MAMTRRNVRRASADSSTKPEVGRRASVNRKRCQSTKKAKTKSEGGPDTHTPKMLCRYIDELEPNKRLLMRDWLTREVRQGDVRGLRWLNPEKTLLEIPWLHGSRHGWQNEDCELFKRWAIHTGKYDENEKDSKRWKANFRCAINSLPDVKEETCLTQKKGANAFRVYRFLTAKPKRSQCKRISRRSKPYTRDFERDSELKSSIKQEVHNPSPGNLMCDSPSTPSFAYEVSSSSSLSPPLSAHCLEPEDSFQIKRIATDERVLDIFDPDHSYAANGSGPMSGRVIPKVVEALNESGKSLHQTGGFMYDNNPSPTSVCSSDSSSGGSSPRTDLDETDHQVTDMVTAWEMETDHHLAPPDQRMNIFNCHNVIYPTNAYSEYGCNGVLIPIHEQAVSTNVVERESIQLMQLA